MSDVKTKLQAVKYVLIVIQMLGIFSSVIMLAASVDALVDAQEALIRQQNGIPDPPPFMADGRPTRHWYMNKFEEFYEDFSSSDSMPTGNKLKQRRFEAIILTSAFSFCLLFYLMGFVGVIKQNVPMCVVFGCIMAISAACQFFGRGRFSRLLMAMGATLLMIVYVRLIKEEAEERRQRDMLNASGHAAGLQQLMAVGPEGSGPMAPQFVVLQDYQFDDKPPPYSEAVNPNY